MDQNLVVRLNQVAINGIRSAGARSQIINVEGNSWSGAWTWVSKSQNGASMHVLTDPSNKIHYQMHQYLDIDGSGTHEECVSSTIGEERLREATQWLRQNRKIGILGEFAGGDNPQCIEAIRGMLSYMQKNNDVWRGWLWWSAGPWWGKYMYSIEPKDGKAVKPYLDLLLEYL
jgi:endoglucanase